MLLQSSNYIFAPWCSDKAGAIYAASPSLLSHRKEEDSTALLELLHLQQYKQAQGAATCVVGQTCQHEANQAMLSLLHSQLTELTTAGLRAGAAAA